MPISIQAKFMKSFFILSSQVYTRSGAPHFPRTSSLKTAIGLLFLDMGMPNTHGGINVTLVFCAWLISLSTSASKFSDAIHVTVCHSFAGWLCATVCTSPLVSICVALMSWWTMPLGTGYGSASHRSCLTSLRCVFIGGVSLSCAILTPIYLCSKIF